MIFERETDLRIPVIPWLENRYAPCKAIQEVAVNPSQRMSRTIDIVVFGNDLIVSVELKLNSALEALVQTEKVLKHSHESWVGTPRKPRADTIERFLTAGVGLLQVKAEEVRVVLEPLRRATASEVLIYAAGDSDQYKRAGQAGFGNERALQVSEALRLAALEDEDGIVGLKEIAGEMAVKLGYADSSAFRRAVRNFARQNKLEGVEIQGNNATAIVRAV